MSENVEVKKDLWFCLLFCMLVKLGLHIKGRTSVKHEILNEMYCPFFY